MITFLINLGTTLTNHLASLTVSSNSDRRQNNIDKPKTTFNIEHGPGPAKKNT